MKHFEREALIWAARVDAESKLILLALNQYLGSNKSAWPSISKLAFDTNLSETTIKRRLANLNRIGIVEINHRYSRGLKISSEYTILWTAIGVVSVCLDPEATPTRSGRGSQDDAKSDRSPRPIENQNTQDDAKSDRSPRPIVGSPRPIVGSPRPIDLIQRSNPKDLTHKDLIPNEENLRAQEIADIQKLSMNKKFMDHVMRYLKTTPHYAERNVSLTNARIYISKPEHSFKAQILFDEFLTLQNSPNLETPQFRAAPLTNEVEPMPSFRERYAKILDAKTVANLSKKTLDC